MIVAVRRDPSGCSVRPEELTALVDGALSGPQRERVLIHLVDCEGCHAQVAQLRRLRLLLGGGVEIGATPSAMEERLRAIAGDGADEPLRARSLRPAPNRMLPRTRRFRRIVPSLTVVAGLMMLSGVGLLAAPPVVTVADPVTGAKTEFSAVVAEQPLSSGPLSALLYAPTALEIPTASTESVRSLSGTMVDAAVAAVPAALEPATVLARAADADAALSYSGTQVVAVATTDGARLARMYVRTTAGRDTTIEILSAGAVVDVVNLPANPLSRVVDTEQIALISENFALRAWSGARAAGRAATVVEATNRGDGMSRAGASSSLAARWWVDDATGLLLWFETYDSAWRVTAAAGFTRVRIDRPASAAGASAAAGRAVAQPMTVDQALQLGGRGWFCPSQLSGLALVRARADVPESPSALKLAYTDGLSTVGVFEQRGSLTAVPTGATWDPASGAYVRIGTPSVAVWQSGDLVFTVVTDGTADLLASAVGDLPHDEAPARTTMDRIRAGWTRILDSVTG